ncbi:hypothetical protein MY4038_003277 [Beauveria bassiana]
MTLASAPSTSSSTRLISQGWAAACGVETTPRGFNEAAAARGKEGKILDQIQHPVPALRAEGAIVTSETQCDNAQNPVAMRKHPGNTRAL